jgi:carbonic anhydrase
MHFHWRGSEHFLSGKKYAAELHLVHQNVQYEEKFAVLGFLFEVSQ